MANVSGPPEPKTGAKRPASRPIRVATIAVVSAAATLAGLFQHQIFGNQYAGATRGGQPLICDPIDPPAVYLPCLERGGTTPLLQ